MWTLLKYDNSYNMYVLPLLQNLFISETTKYENLCMHDIFCDKHLTRSRFIYGSILKVVNLGILGTHDFVRTLVLIR